MPYDIFCKSNVRRLRAWARPFQLCYSKKDKKIDMELLSESQGTYTGPKPGSPEQIRAITAELWRLYPDAKCSLDFSNPLELFVATQLSAQCTDERVNLVTPALFRKYRNAEDYATASQEELEQDIRSTGFYRNKAKNLRAAAQRLVTDYDGEVPRTMADLLTLH